MQLELSNFQPLAANQASEEEAPDLGSAKQLSKPMIEESDQGLASLIRSIGMTSITDIDNLVSELQDARDYLQSEGERIRAEVAQYAALAEAASASVKIIFDVLRAWRTTGHPAHNQSRASAFEITDAVIEDTVIGVMDLYGHSDSNRLFGANSQVAPPSRRSGAETTGLAATSSEH